jgi:hypothetical protein
MARIEPPERPRSAGHDARTACKLDVLLGMDNSDMIQPSVFNAGDSSSQSQLNVIVISP